MKKMPKFIVCATEVVKYAKEVEAKDEGQVREMVFNGEIDFNYGDIVDGWDFDISEIEEAKRYA
jgi:hypothetical protein